MYIFKSSNFFSQAIPIYRVLMRKKSKAAYELVFKLLKKLLVKNVTAITTDYEKAVADASEKIYQNAEKKKFFFHFTQVKIIINYKIKFSCDVTVTD